MYSEARKFASNPEHLERSKQASKHVYVGAFNDNEVGQHASNSLSRGQANWASYYYSMLLLLAPIVVLVLVLVLVLRNSSPDERLWCDFTFIFISNSH